MPPAKPSVERTMSERRKLRNLCLGLGRGSAAGPVLAVPVPVGGSLPVAGEGDAATAAVASAGVGGVLGVCEMGISVEVFGASMIGG